MGAGLGSFFGGVDGRSVSHSPGDCRGSSTSGEVDLVRRRALLLDPMLDRVDLRWGGVRVSKNIVVLSDGTGQEGGEGHNTNIYRMFDMVEDRTQRQVVYYDAGVGTGWRKVTGNAFGRGFSRNIRQAYQFIFEQFEVGDRIYLIGFSRGAATVRSLSGFIFHFGILPRSRPKLIKQAFRIYKIGRAHV